ncbi:MAG: gluconokinase [Chloroflexota bacterium]
MSAHPPNIETPLILTLDIGTSSTRAMLFDAQGKVVPGYQAQQSYQATTVSVAGESGVEFDPEMLFTKIVETVDELLAQAGALATEIAAVAADSLVTNILGIDENDQPITPLYTYAGTRNAADAQALRDDLRSEGVAVVHDRTGCLVHAAYLPARIHWFKRTNPDVAKKVKRWVSIGELLYGRLFGEWEVSYSVASWTGLLNRHNLQWDAGWLETLALDESNLSSLLDIDQAFIGLQPEWGTRWPSLKKALWLPAIGDGAAANIGSGCDLPNRIALTVGTTGAMRVVLSQPVARVPDGLWFYRVDAKRGLLGGATTEGGNLFAWFQQTLQLPEETILEEALALQQPTTHGLTILPFIAGERAPGWRDDAQASIIGYTLDTTPVEIVRAGLESIAYRFALIHQRITPHLPPDRDQQIIASGGAILSSPAWLQIMADVLGHPVQTLAEGEATSRGVALLALEVLGQINRPSDLPPTIGNTYLPEPSRYEVYQAALEKQVVLYDQILGVDIA